MHLKCGHSFKVTALDGHVRLGDVYQLSSAGTIECGRVKEIPAMDLLRCPDCSASIKGVQRYRRIEQLAALETTMDRMNTMLGRRVRDFVFECLMTEEVLPLHFEAFCRDIKSGPLAGHKNEILVRHRGYSMQELQDMILRYRNEVAGVYEENMGRLVRQIDNAEVLERTTSSFKLHLDFVYFRCRVAIVEDGARIIQHLESLEGEDQHVTIMSSMLRREVQHNALGEIKGLQDRGLECHANGMKRLEVEMLLTQLKFHLILRSLGMDSGLDVEQTSWRIMDAGCRFPETAGQLIKTYHSLQPFLGGLGLDIRLSPLGADELRRLWQKLGKQEPGDLARCSKHHRYSAITFVRCPECGPEIGPR
jgi:DNA-directed RNA polymerase subunit RPC12/RpoP